MPISWNQQYAQRTQRITSSAIRELLKVTEQTEVISFAGGLPAPDIFPIEEIAVAADQVLRDAGAQALQYSPTEGYRPLREWIAQQIAATGPQLSLDNILITSGSQQALDLLGKIFINPGDRLVVQAPTYLGALQAWNSYEAAYLPVPADEQGMITARLETALQTGPKFIYISPNFQNPTGVTLTLARRQQLVELADHYGVPIIEDDPYGQLRFEGDHLPTVLALAGSPSSNGHGNYQGNVIYLSTFSKTLVPGLRVGAIVAPAEVIHKLVQVKQGADLHSATFNQMLVYEVIRTGLLQQHLPVICQLYRERRDLMLSAMAAHFPPGVQWTHPSGGLFIWVVLPEGIDAAELLPAALAEKVAFVPGASMFPGGGGMNTLRLNFSNASPAKISEGIARLGRVLQEKLDHVGVVEALAKS